ncbi:hypothetical protein HTZ84_14200 [Haloterrigena sp. SYSU A558-1]|uniref:Uncharacterized protein n=1 Tax=Haloterrigena gelatinilytica TaxID=2741724 RepID=A0A8J8KAX9_9EURY|nr:hypothetical protein [Haloterrigena gelatinilytica]NUB90730.1 hypothetical protein [Haloterrigena gelatinilytica]NUC73452.1 hypothetical protein [Haloterrigena gelatinilytica]
MATDTEVDTDAFDEISLTNQVVLLGVAELQRRGETPVQTHVLRRVCRTQLEGVDVGVIGTLTEADVMRSLYRLEDEGFVEEIETEGTSPTGKGRPAYALDVDPEIVEEGVADELLEPTD